MTSIDSCERPGASSVPLLSILMPVYNERAFLRRCVERVLAAPLPDGLCRELVIVDDASTDGTSDLIRELAARWPGLIRPFFQETNQGKGAAVRRAVEEMSGQYAVIQDADLEYDPNDYPLLLEPILEGHADVAYGSRFAPRSMRRVLNYRHTLGNRFLTHLSNFFTGFNLTDIETCYKAFRADVLKTIPIRSNRFGFEPEITAKIAKRRCVVYEVPINYHGRTYDEGKKITWKDGVAAICTILKFWLIDDCFEDHYGRDMLVNLSRARRFTQWTVQMIRPYLGQRIIEIGSGIGNISRHLPRRERLTLTDVDPVCLGSLENANRHDDLVTRARLNLACDADFEPLAGQYDTVLCLNVLEHIDNDLSSLVRMRRLLEPGGRLILIVPQYQRLYGAYDEHLAHRRRYNRRALLAMMEEAGFRIVKTRSFNLLGVLGWWLNSRLLRRRQMGRFQLKAFDTFVPILKGIEAVVPLPGLSLLAVAERTE